MQDALVVVADEMVGEGVKQSGVPLTHELRHYLAITMARFMHEDLDVDGLTVRVTAAMDRCAPADILRHLGDQCLVACSFFEARLRRSGGSLRHYSGLGQVAYDAAEMTPQAWGFPAMRDVLATVANTEPERKLRELIDAARAGSEIAREDLREANVVAFPARGLFR